MFQVGESIGPYVVRRALGTHRVADRYEVEHGTTGVRHHVLVLQVDSGAAPAGLVRQFGLRHPNIVAVQGVVDAVGFLTLVTEPFDGTPLSDRVRDFDQEEALGLFMDVLHGVAAAHEAGVRHLDIDPDNVLLGSSPYGGTVAKVTGFYLAKMVEDQEKESRQVFSRFAAPEMFTADDAADERADVYALGTLLYEMLAKEAAFGGDVVSSLRRRATETYVPLDQACPGVPHDVAAAVHKALRTNRKDRFQTCLAFGKALFGDTFEPILADRALEVARAERSTTPPPRQRSEQPGPEREAQPIDRPIPAWLFPVVLVPVLVLGFLGLTWNAVFAINSAEDAVITSTDAVNTAMAERGDITADLIAAGAQKQVLDRALAAYDNAPADEKPAAAYELYDVIKKQLVVLSAEGSAEALGTANRVDRSLSRIERSLDNHRQTVVLWNDRASGWRGDLLSSLGVVDQPSEGTLRVLATR